jgi:hypothetical protein
VARPPTPGPGRLSGEERRHSASERSVRRRVSCWRRFADQAAYDAHTGSAAYRELIAGQFAGLIVEFVEIDHELLVAH